MATFGCYCLYAALYVLTRTHYTANQQS